MVYGEKSDGGRSETDLPVLLFPFMDITQLAWWSLMGQNSTNFTKPTTKGHSHSKKVVLLRGHYQWEWEQEGQSGTPCHLM